MEYRVFQHKKWIKISTSIFQAKITASSCLKGVSLGDSHSKNLLKVVIDKACFFFHEFSHPNTNLTAAFMHYIHFFRYGILKTKTNQSSLSGIFLTPKLLGPNPRRKCTSRQRLSPFCPSMNLTLNLEDFTLDTITGL